MPRWRRAKANLSLRRLRGDGPFQGLGKAWRSIAGRRLPDVSPHTLRHSFASTAEDVGLTIPTIRALIGHSGGGDATSRYIHKLDATLIAAANRVAESIANQMELYFNRSLCSHNDCSLNEPVQSRLPSPHDHKYYQAGDCILCTLYLLSVKYFCYYLPQ